MDAPTPQQLVAHLVRLLTPEPNEDGAYRGLAPEGGKGRAFGGRLIGQALAAAQAAAAAAGPERPPHSLHAYFMRPGDEAELMSYRVEPVREGASFSLVRVTAEQGGRLLLAMMVSLQAPEGGPEHGAEAPDVPPPEGLPTETEIWRDRQDELPPGAYAFLSRPRPVEIRPVTRRPFAPMEPRPPVTQFWLRAAAPLPDDAALHRAVLGYTSDMMLLPTVFLPHAVSWFTHPLRSASLDHALWIHAQPRMDDWLLFSFEAPRAGGGRGFARGQVFDRRGTLVASIAQEGLFRLGDRD